MSREAGGWVGEKVDGMGRGGNHGAMMGRPGGAERGWYCKTWAGLEGGRGKRRVVWVKEGGGKAR